MLFYRYNFILFFISIALLSCSDDAKLGPEGPPPTVETGSCPSNNPPLTGNGLTAYADHPVGQLLITLAMEDMELIESHQIQTILIIIPQKQIPVRI